MDTAGIRHNTTDPIEQEGIARAISSAASADLVLKVLDASKMPMVGLTSKSSASQKSCTFFN